MPVLVGTSGDDYIVAPETNDTVSGLQGDDYILGGFGDDSLAGGEGADTLGSGNGSDTLDGGTGDDSLWASFGASLLLGGAGNDTLNANLGSTLNGGAGDDLIWGRIDQVLIGGEGSDLYQIPLFLKAAVISDFQPGVGGDRLDLDAPLNGSLTYRGGNPFGEGFMRLVQSGVDTVIEVDEDGPGGAAKYGPWMRLSGVSAAQLVADNFMGFRPDGSPAAGAFISVGPALGARRTTGTVGNDTIIGGAGFDIIHGSNGNDSIQGGENGGQLLGDTGDDTIVGGSQSDLLSDWSGRNLLQGGGGADTLIGGTGCTLEGGAGDDRLDPFGAATLSGGAGSDTYFVGGVGQAFSTWTATDFQPGANGDIFFVMGSSQSEAVPDLFLKGQLRLVQDGADVKVYVDEDGWGSRVDPSLLAILKNVSADQLTAFNFSGSGPRGGTTGNDTFAGSANFSFLRGEEGNDKVVGSDVFDDINGNMGDDTLSGGGGGDWVVGGKDNDLLNGDAGDDIVYGNLGQDWCDGGVGNDVVRGGQGNDVLLGQTGNDWLSGDRGDDTLVGGSGADIFHGFRDAGIDRVTDFNFAEGDRVLLDAGASFSVVQQGSNVVIDFGPVDGAPNQMILVNVSLASLPDGWLIVT